MLVNHFCVSVVIVFFLAVVLGGTNSISALQTLASCIAVLVYALNIYSGAYSYAADDLKTYSPLKPYASKGFVLSLGIVIAIALSWIFYIVSWQIAPIADKLIPSTVIANLIYIILTGPFMQFVNVQGGSANLWGQIAAIIIPVALSAKGYYDGYKKKDLFKFINKFVYEKKKK